MRTARLDRCPDARPGFSYALSVYMSNVETGPDAELARQRYRSLAKRYDRIAFASRPLRRLAVERLKLARGDVVLDIACGTGLTFPLLEERIGPEGRIIGVDLSGEMLEQARDRVRAVGWRNVTLVESPVEAVSLPVEADAAVFVLTHDVLQSPDAVANVISQLKPGARVASAGAKRPRWSVFPLNLYVARTMRRYTTTEVGVEEPWRELRRLVPNLRARSTLLGAAYVAWGIKPHGQD